jgi:hypothetical protein
MPTERARDVNGKSYVRKCWRCREIQWMKDPDNPLLKSVIEWDEDMVDRFIRIWMLLP